MGSMIAFVVTYSPILVHFPQSPPTTRRLVPFHLFLSSAISGKWAVVRVLLFLPRLRRWSKASQFAADNKKSNYRSMKFIRVHTWYDSSRKCVAAVRVLIFPELNNTLVEASELAVYKKEVYRSFYFIQSCMTHHVNGLQYKFLSSLSWIKRWSKRRSSPAYLTIWPHSFVYDSLGNWAAIRVLVLLELSTTFEASKLIAFHKNSTVSSRSFVYDSLSIYWLQFASLFFLSWVRHWSKRRSSSPSTRTPPFHLVHLCKIHQAYIGCNSYPCSSWVEYNVDPWSRETKPRMWSPSLSFYVVY